jgi:hypothetical protein
MTRIPERDAGGSIPSALPKGKVRRPKNVGMDGPVMSASRMPTFFP